MTTSQQHHHRHRHQQQEQTETIPMPLLRPSFENSRCVPSPWPAFYSCGSTSTRPLLATNSPPRPHRSTLTSIMWWTGNTAFVTSISWKRTRHACEPVMATYICCTCGRPAARVCKRSCWGRTGAAVVARIVCRSSFFTVRWARCGVRKVIIIGHKIRSFHLL